MEAVTLPIYNSEGKEVESLKLDATVFDGKVNQDALHQAVTAYLANQRKGLAATKTRGEVSGGGRKPWKQKGTGRARHGSIRSPLWRHGGVVFGPHPRDFSYSLPQKIKNLALKSSLNAKLKEKNLVLLDNLNLNSYKAKEAARIFKQLKIESKTLLLLDKMDVKVKQALRNIGFLKFNLSRDTHAYEVLAAHKLILTKDGLKELVSRLKA